MTPVMRRVNRSRRFHNGRADMNHTLRVQLRSLAFVVVAASAAPVHADSSRALEHALRLYERGDYWSATVEFRKVVDGEAGDTADDRTRATLFLGKSLYQVGLYVPALTLFDHIVDRDDDGTYR